MRPVPIAHSYEVIADRFYAGEYPRDRSDKTSSAKVQKFLDFGITDFIDLTEEGELKPYTSLLPSSVAHCRFPIIDLTPPKTMEQLHDIHTTIDRLISSGKKVYVHCWGGINRTGFIVGCWLIFKGASVAEAMTEFERLWATNPKSGWETPLIRGRKDYVSKYADWLKKSGKK
jgi:protein-tyrosine phosphatase